MYFNFFHLSVAHTEVRVQLGETVTLNVTNDLRPPYLKKQLMFDTWETVVLVLTYWVTSVVVQYSILGFFSMKSK